MIRYRGAWKNGGTEEEGGIKREQRLLQVFVRASERASSVLVIGTPLSLSLSLYLSISLSLCRNDDCAWNAQILRRASTEEREELLTPSNQTHTSGVAAWGAMRHWFDVSPKRDWQKEGRKENTWRIDRSTDGRTDGRTDGVD